MQMASKKGSNWVNANVACERLNFRKTPSLSSEVIRVLNNGEPLMIRPAENSEWAKARIDDDIGFVMSKFLFVASPVSQEVGDE